MYLIFLISSMGATDRLMDVTVPDELMWALGSHGVK
jgi:hypothetical protein